MGRGGFFVVAGLLSFAPAPTAAQGPPPVTRAAPPSPMRAVIDISKRGPPIEPLMYGHFIENLRNWFERGIWAELIGDRKFFYPVNDDSVQTPVNGRRNLYGRWAPIGPAERVTMDTARAYGGDHVPRIRLDGSTPHGFSQASIPLRGNLAYSGRIVLAGDPGTRAQVALVWGPGPNDRHAVDITPTAEYRAHQLRFQPTVDTRDGRLEITATGSGNMWVGAVSLMRADHLEGWNPEFIAILKEMRPTLLRWGGNWSANYEWRDGIGDPDRRPTRYDFAWNAIEPNDVGTLEVLALNRLLGSEPNLQVNAALGDAHSAAQWVEYVNGASTTPMGRLRGEHGHPEPFGVKWWGIGNEMYGEWQIGHMYIGHYVIKHNIFAREMRKVDPSIALVASGASRYQQSADSRDRWRTPVATMPPFQFDSPQDWTGWLLRHSWRNMAYISEHIYGAQDEFAYVANEQRWVSNVVPLQDRLRQIPNRIQGVAEDWYQYLERMPWLEDSGIKMVLDEWHAGGSDLFVGLWTALGLNELYRHTDVYKMSAWTCLACALAYNSFDPPVLRSGGLVFKLFANQAGTIPVLGITGNSPQPELRGTVGVDRPQTSSGSPTYPLDVMATLSEDGRRLAVTVINPSEASHQLVMEVLNGGAAAGFAKSGRKWTMAGASIDARNVAGQAPMIPLVEAEVPDLAAPLTVPALSISLYEFQLR